MCYNDAMNWWTLIMTLSDVCLATGCTEPEQIFEISTYDINFSGEFLKPHHHQRILFLPCIFKNWPWNFLTPGSLATVHRLCLSSVQTPDPIHLRRVCRLTQQCIPHLAKRTFSIPPTHFHVICKWPLVGQVLDMKVVLHCLGDVDIHYSPA